MKTKRPYAIRVIAPAGERTTDRFATLEAAESEASHIAALHGYDVDLLDLFGRRIGTVTPAYARRIR